MTETTTERRDSTRFQIPGGHLDRIRQSGGRIRDFPLDNSDILVLGYPKSGTTWLQQVILLMSQFNNHEKQLKMDEKFPYLEFSITSLVPLSSYPTPEEIAQRPSPRFIKSHLPYGLLPQGAQEGRAKMVYIARNVKDVCVSNYHFIRMISGHKYHGTFNDFFGAFTTGEYLYGSWLDHVAEYWKHRHDDNVLFLCYEDLYKKRPEVVRQIAAFLDRNITEEQLSDIVHKTSFDVMKDDDTVNYSWLQDKGFFDKSVSQFMRKGIIGDWQNYFSPEMDKEMEEIYLEPLRQQGLHFDDQMV